MTTEAIAEDADVTGQTADPDQVDLGVEVVPDDGEDEPPPLLDAPSLPHGSKSADELFARDPNHGKEVKGYDPKRASRHVLNEDGQVLEPKNYEVGCAQRGRGSVGC